MFISVYNFLSNNLPSTLLGLIFVYLAQHFFRNLKLRNRLPPGPFGFPFVGYIPFLGKDPHRRLAKLGEKYGSVFT